jgi:hypothetical protein
MSSQKETDSERFMYTLHRGGHEQRLDSRHIANQGEVIYGTEIQELAEVVSDIIGAGNVPENATDQLLKSVSSQRPTTKEERDSLKVHFRRKGARCKVVDIVGTELYVDGRGMALGENFRNVGVVIVPENCIVLRAGANIKHIGQHVNAKGSNATKLRNKCGEIHRRLCSAWSQLPVNMVQWSDRSIAQGDEVKSANAENEKKAKADKEAEALESVRKQQEAHEKLVTARQALNEQISVNMFEVQQVIDSNGTTFDVTEGKMFNLNNEEEEKIPTDKILALSTMLDAKFLSKKWKTGDGTILRVLQSKLASVYEHSYKVVRSKSFRAIRDSLEEDVDLSTRVSVMLIPENEALQNFEVWVFTAPYEYLSHEFISVFCSSNSVRTGV